MIVAIPFLISVSTYEKFQLVLESICSVKNDGNSRPFPAIAEYPVAILPASSIPILFINSNGPSAHLSPTLAPLSTSSMLQISSSTICAATAKTTPSSLSATMLYCS